MHQLEHTLSDRGERKVPGRERGQLLQGSEDGLSGEQLGVRLRKLTGQRLRCEALFVGYEALFVALVGDHAARDAEGGTHGDDLKETLLAGGRGMLVPPADAQRADDAVACRRGDTRTTRRCRAPAPAE